MSVYDAEPDVPNDDNGKGLRLIGWLLLIWDAITLVVIPGNQQVSSFMPGIRWALFFLGVAFVAAGYWKARHDPTKTIADERAHAMMVASRSGQQNDALELHEERGTPPRVVGYDPERQRDVIDESA